MVVLIANQKPFKMVPTIFHQDINHRHSIPHPWVKCLIRLLLHWGRVTHICASKQTIIGSDNGLPPGRRQVIIWTNAGILLIGPVATKFNDILIEIHTISFKEMRLKMSSGKWRPFCLGLNVLIILNNTESETKRPLFCRHFQSSSFD